ncbi:MAG: hypothetical protein ABR543_15435 [Gemmatimonadaceae bacterium]
MRLVERIDLDIRKAYKSLDDPDLRFKHEMMIRQPYSAVQSALTERFDNDLRDDTDPNVDVSFVWGLERRGRIWIVFISMIGPYAAVTREEGDPIAPNVVVGSDEDETALLHIIQEFGFTVLDKTMLERPCKLRLFNTEPERIRIFQALFANTDLLPWERPSIEY